MSKGSQTKSAEMKTTLTLFIVAIILALVAGGAAIAFNIFLVTENNTTEFEAIIESRENYSTPQVFIIKIKTECFDTQLHLYQATTDLHYMHFIRSGEAIRFRIRNRHVERFEDGRLDSVRVVSFGIWGLLESETIEIAEGVYEDNEVWGYRVMATLDSFNEGYILPSILIPSILGVKALVFFIIAGTIFIKAKTKEMGEVSL